MGKKYICLDIGGTKVLGAVFDDNQIITRLKKKTKAVEGVEKLNERIIILVNEIAEKAGIDVKDVTAICAGSSGIIDEDKGVSIYSPHLPWKNYNIKQAIEEKFNVPFFIGNDVNVGVLGEWKYGAGIGKKNLVGLFVGTGLGGGIVINDKLYTGSRYAAGEIGHMIIHADGAYCNCGQRGCFETYASKSAMIREIKAELDRGRKSILRGLMDDDLTILRSKALKKAVEEMDSLAIEVLNRAIYYLAIGTGSVINIFNPEMVVLGGGVFEAMSEYIMPIFNKHIQRFTMPNLLEGTQVVTSKLQDDAGVYGALAMIQEKLKLKM